MYKIKDVIYLRNEKLANHIPYFFALIVEGPRQCRYLIDVFNTEILLRKALKVGVLPNRTDIIIHNMARDLHINETTLNIRELNINESVFLKREPLEYNKLKEITECRRLIYRNSSTSNSEIIDKIASNLSLTEA